LGEEDFKKNCLTLTCGGNDRGITSREEPEILTRASLDGIGTERKELAKLYVDGKKNQKDLMHVKGATSQLRVRRRTERCKCKRRHSRSNQKKSSF